jgi:hypothetical protein
MYILFMNHGFYVRSLSYPRLSTPYHRKTRRYYSRAFPSSSTALSAHPGILRKKYPVDDVVTLIVGSFVEVADYVGTVNFEALWGRLEERRGLAK